jgi:hypothetical protein
MTAYEKIKEWLKQKENKQKLVFGLSFVVVFIVGFGAGSYSKTIRRETYKPQTNYTTNSAQKPAAATAVKAAPVAAVTATSTNSTTCIVKGNIGSGGKKIYHVKGGAFYDRTKAEQCFNTEAEALAAGFVKSSR